MAGTPERQDDLVPPVAAWGAPVDDYIAEGGDDVWDEAVLPRPAPLRQAAEPSEPFGEGARTHAWHRLPQALVVGALVATTAGYAMVGDVTASAGPVQKFVRAAAVIDPAATSAAAATSDIAVGSALVAGEDGLLRVQAADAANRSGERALLPGCDGVPPETPQPNGSLDDEFLCLIWDGKTEMRADAAVAVTVLNEQYRASTGGNLCVTSGYRTFGQQAALRRQKPGLAAPAGTSEHGNGLAVDLCGGVEREGAAYDWLEEHGPALGFINPDWAKRGGSGPFEPWHWEYVNGQW